MRRINGGGEGDGDEPFIQKGPLTRGKTLTWTNFFMIEGDKYYLENSRHACSQT